MTDTRLGIIPIKLPDPDQAERAKSSRARKYKLKKAAARLLPGMRVCWCGHRMAKSIVEGWQDQDTGKVFHKGLSMCGSVWVCPICASRISEKRRIELEDAVSRSGLTPVLVTVTLQHSREDRLSSLIEDLNTTLRSLKMGGWWTRWKEKYNVKAYVSSLEVTWGADNGWHPHKHWLLFCDLPADQLDQDTLKAELTARYTGLLAKHGRYASDHYGIDVIIGQPAAVEVGRYVSKWGLASEVTKAVVKTGKTGLSPWQLLEIYSEGDKQAGALFIEYAKATAGSKQLQWSHKGRQALGLSGVEKSDAELVEELAEDETGKTGGQNAVLIYTLNSEEWALIEKADADLLILEIAEYGGAAAVQVFLEGLWERYRHRMKGVKNDPE